MELKSVLNIESYDKDELFLILSDFFTVSIQTNNYELSMYLSESDANQNLEALTCTFSKKKRKLVSINTGPAFPNGYVEKIKQTLDSDLIKTNKHIGNEILFSGIPVQEGYLVNDLFQILPRSKDEHKPKHFMALHPFLLKFKFYDSPNTTISLYRSQSKAKELQLLLSVFLNTSISSTNLAAAKHHWVSNNEKDWNEQIIQSMTKVEPHVYFDQDFPIPPLKAPSNFEGLFDKFYSLESELQMKFLRAAYWLQHSSDVNEISKSASFLALINAIETLAADEEDLSKCPTCNKKEGVTKQFKTFLKRFLPGLDEKEMSKFYSLRSELTHGKRLFEGDQGKFMSFNPFDSKEHYDYYEMKFITRISLISWLTTK